MKIRVLLSVIGLVLALGSSARAALVWENPEVDLHPTLSDKTAVAHFKYKNTGDKPIKITTVQPSCGCTTAAPPKDAIAPGASGEIVATLNIGDRFGPQHKTIRIATDEPNSEGAVLKLNATIPRLLEITPTFLYWRRGEERKPKTLDVKIQENFPVTKLDVTSTDPTIKVESAPVPNEKAFRITVTPATGDHPVNASLKIQPDYPKEGSRTFSAFVRVDGAVGVPSSTPVAVAPWVTGGSSPPGPPLRPPAVPVAPPK